MPVGFPGDSDPRDEEVDRECPVCADLLETDFFGDRFCPTCVQEDGDKEANANTLADLAVALEQRDEALKNQQPTTVGDTLRQIRTALAAMLCADEEHCPTLREARMLCVEAIRLLNAKLNTEAKL